MNYFERVSRLSPTKFWVNNVTREQAGIGLKAGASGCTQNPAYTWKMLTHSSEKDYALGILKKLMQNIPNDDLAAREFQRSLIKSVSDAFMPLYQSSRGAQGYVSIQSDPLKEHDWHFIVEDAHKSRDLNPNIMVKVPATKAGLRAVEVLLEENIPLNVTEVMVVDQFMALGKIYSKAKTKTDRPPVLYFSLITGIYNEWLRNDVEKKGIEISKDALYHSGYEVAKKIYRLNHDCGFNMGFISGGSRTLEDFYQMVGGDICVTMNWEGSCDKLIEKDAPVDFKLFTPSSPLILDELNAKLPAFREAYWSGMVSEENFEHNGAVQYFYASFVSAWKNVLKLIKDNR